jgi:hypothetical protein
MAMTQRRGGDPRRVRAEAKAREQRVLEAWAKRVSLATIAANEGYTNTQSVSRTIRRALSRAPSPEAETRRARDLVMLDSVLQRQFELAERTYYHFNQAGWIMDPDGNPIIDVEPNRRFFADIVRTEARIAVLAGLDAPIRQRIEYIEPEQVMELIRKMNAESDRMEAEMASGKIVGRIGLPG